MGFLNIFRLSRKQSDNKKALMLLSNIDTTLKQMKMQQAAELECISDMISMMADCVKTEQQGAGKKRWIKTWSGY